MKKYILSYKNKTIVQGNLATVLIKIFKIAEETGTILPTIDVISDMTVIKFEGYFCDFNLHIEEVS